MASLSVNEGRGRTSLRRERPDFGDVRVFVSFPVIRCSSAIFLVIWAFCHAHPRQSQSYDASACDSAVVQGGGICGPKVGVDKHPSNNKR